MLNAFSLTIRDHSNRPILQNPHSIELVSHNAPFLKINVHTYAHFCYKMVHCWMRDWCTEGFVQQAGSIFGSWAYQYSHISELLADHIHIGFIPALLTHAAPGAIVVDLQTTLVDARTKRQPHQHHGLSWIPIGNINYGTCYLALIPGSTILTLVLFKSLQFIWRTGPRFNTTTTLLGIELPLCKMIMRLFGLYNGNPLYC